MILIYRLRMSMKNEIEKNIKLKMTLLQQMEKMIHNNKNEVMTPKYSNSYLITYDEEKRQRREFIRSHKNVIVWTNDMHI